MKKTLIACAVSALVLTGCSSVAKPEKEQPNPSPKPIEQPQKPETPKKPDTAKKPDAKPQRPQSGSQGSAPRPQPSPQPAPKPAPQQPAPNVDQALREKATTLTVDKQALENLKTAFEASKQAKTEAEQKLQQVEQALQAANKEVEASAFQASIKEKLIARQEERLKDNSLSEREKAQAENILKRAKEERDQFNLKAAEAAAVRDPLAQEKQVALTKKKELEQTIRTQQEAILQAETLQTEIKKRVKDLVGEMENQTVSVFNADGVKSPNADLAGGKKGVISGRLEIEPEKAPAAPAVPAQKKSLAYQGWNGDFGLVAQTYPVSGEETDKANAKGQLIAGIFSSQAAFEANKNQTVEYKGNASNRWSSGEFSYTVEFGDNGTDSAKGSGTISGLKKTGGQEALPALKLAEASGIQAISGVASAAGINRAQGLKKESGAITAEGQNISNASYQVAFFGDKAEEVVGTGKFTLENTEYDINFGGKAEQK